MEEPKCVLTIKDFEAIYEYSDFGHGPKNLAKVTPENKGVEILLYYNSGKRTIKITNSEKRTSNEYELVNPKKPEDTGVVLKIGSKDLLVPEKIAEELLKVFPESIHKVQ